MDQDPVGLGNSVEGKNRICGSQPDRLLGHDKEDTAFFVLGDIPSTRLLHHEHAVGSVIAHAGQHDTDGVLASIACEHDPVIDGKSEAERARSA